MQAVSAGVDIDLGGDAFMNLTHAVQSGKISEAVIDTAVCRVLRMKFEIGLFEHPYVNPKQQRRWCVARTTSNWHAKWRNHLLYY